MPPLGGTTTVVFFSGGGELLLLMHADKPHSMHSEARAIFILIPFLRDWMVTTLTTDAALASRPDSAPQVSLILLLGSL